MISPEEHIKFEDTVSYVLARVATAFRTDLERHMSQVGLHSGQIFVLLELWRQDDLRQIDLASRLSVSAPTVNKMIKGLIDIGLIERSRLAEDGRSTRIQLTDEGTAMRYDVEEQWREMEEACLASLTEAERLMVFELLGKLRTAYTGQGAPDDE